MQGICWSDVNESPHLYSDTHSNIPAPLRCCFSCLWYCPLLNKNNKRRKPPNHHFGCITSSKGREKSGLPRNHDVTIVWRLATTTIHPSNTQVVWYGLRHFLLLFVISLCRVYLWSRYTALKVFMLLYMNMLDSHSFSHMPNYRKILIIRLSMIDWSTISVEPIMYLPNDFLDCLKL